MEVGLDLNVKLNIVQTGILLVIFLSEGLLYFVFYVHFPLEGDKFFPEIFVVVVSRALLVKESISSCSSNLFLFRLASVLERILILNFQL